MAYKTKPKITSILSRTFILLYDITKGSMITVVDALNRIHEVNMLSFIEITSDLYDCLGGMYPDDSYFANHWVKVEHQIFMIALEERILMRVIPHF